MSEAPLHPTPAVGRTVLVLELRVEGLRFRV